MKYKTIIIFILVVFIGLVGCSKYDPHQHITPTDYELYDYCDNHYCCEDEELITRVFIGERDMGETQEIDEMLYIMEYDKEVIYLEGDGHDLKDVTEWRIYNRSVNSYETIIKIETYEQDKERLYQQLFTECLATCNEGYQETESGQFVLIMKGEGSDCKRYREVCVAEDVVLSGYKCIKYKEDG